MTDRIADPWGERTPYAAGERWPVRVDRHTVEEPERWVRSASLLHSNGDAIDIGVRSGRIVGVRGRASDRVNRGRLDPKDVYGWQANASPDRLRRPPRPQGRQPGRDRLGRGDDPDRRPVPGAAERAGRLGALRLLHHRTAVPGGVLHARRHRQGRARHAAHGRQHPAVHGDLRLG